MPSCYLLSIVAGSSLDQHSNNVTLFNLVEQVNVPPGNPPPPQGVIPLEIHAYFRFSAVELEQRFDVRFALVALDTGLETFSQAFTHKAPSHRFRTRTLGVPYPPVTGAYELRVDWRSVNDESWKREPTAWPLTILEVDPRPPTQH